MKALVIPVHQPSAALLALLAEIPAGLFSAIVVVDDGSGVQFPPIPGVIVARHALPVGRGAAVRTGIHAALTAVPKLSAVVTADLTHSARAISQLAQVDDAGSLVLGVGEPPRRALLTRATTWAFAGQAISQPETALRSLPARLLPHLLRVSSNGPEFDVETLLVAAEHAAPIVEQALDSAPAPAASSWSAPRALLKFALASRPYRPVGFAFALLTVALLVAVAIAEIHGFSAGHLFRQPIWFPWGERRLEHFTGLFAAWSLPVLVLLPWTYASAFAVMIALATALATGPIAVLGVIFFLISACTLGSKLLGKADLHATLIGIAIYAFTMTLTARLPINYSAAWAAIVALPVLLDWRGVMRRLREWADQVRSFSLPTWSQRGAFALLAFVLCIHWFAAIEPETSSDGLAMHLAIPANIAVHHALTFRPDRFLWSVMPMGADFTYTIAYLLGGEPAASLFNFALLLLLGALIYSANRRWLPRAPALLMVALFASSPLVHLVTGSLFIENFIAAMILGMLSLLWQFHQQGRRGLLFGAAILAGCAASAKLGACVFVLLAVPFAIAAARRQRKHLGVRPAATAALAVALLLTIAAPPYVIAYAKTGNPIFPFANAKFPSPMLEHGVEFRDTRFNQPLRWTTPFDLTFHTVDYFESQNGAFGFQYLLLIPLALVALFATRNYAPRSAAAIGLIAGTIIMATQPNARYVYAALPLLAISFGALVARFEAQQRWLLRALLAAAVVFIAFNVYFEAASGWYHKQFDSLVLFHPQGRAAYLRESAPMRYVTQSFRLAQPQAPVLLVTENDLTDAGDHAFAYEWHQYPIWKRIATAESVPALRNVFKSLGVRYFAGHRSGPDDDPIAPFSLGQFLANCTEPAFEDGRFYVARITAICESLSDAALDAHLSDAPPALVRQGSYDDFDPALRFRGPWTRTKGFTGPFRHTISYTDLPGAQITFAFEGAALTYVYTKAANRGIARLTIDGVAHDIDLYSPTIQWQSRTEFCCLEPGSHTVVLSVTGQKRAASSDTYVDLDSFQAK